MFSNIGTCFSHGSEVDSKEKKFLFVLKGEGRGQNRLLKKKRGTERDFGRKQRMPMGVKH